MEIQQGNSYQLDLFPFVNQSSSDNSTIPDDTTNTENSFFGDIPPAVYAGVGF
ncbi:MAG: hypothetical protein K9W44_10710 [Candidatus Lokiarchaeota archaeon]|nr:hypothetical protein [Candidatus Harpocratesius repetitus]